MAVMTFKKKIDEWQLAYRQKLSLEVKEQMAMNRISKFIDEYGKENVYTSFSGGIDSTVLKHLVERVNRNVMNVYLDTWLEYPSVRRFVHSFDNVTILKPEQSMKEIVKEHGWCFPGKEVAEMIYLARNGSEAALKKLHGLDKDGKPSKYREQFTKWLPLYESDILISRGCCICQKEKPVKKFEQQNDMHPIVGTMADEGAQRKQAYLRGGCLTFDETVVVAEDGSLDTVETGSRPMCRPLGFWTKQDILTYLVKYELPYAAEYGDIVEEGALAGQMSWIPGCRKYCLTGEPRTGCCMCPVAMHLDKFAKFERLKKKEPKLYDYCMEELGEKRLVEWVKENIIRKEV